MLILISAGHSTVAKRDPGACAFGFEEANIALRMRDRVAQILREEFSLSVIEDGADGINEPLTKAITLARRANIAVEFHLNASTNPNASGVECLSKVKDKKFAQALSRAIAVELGAKLRGDAGWLDQSGGQHHRLGFCQAGGVIVELGFISNHPEIERLNARFDRIARVVALIVAEQAGRKISRKPATALVTAAAAQNSARNVPAVLPQNPIVNPSVSALNLPDSTLAQQNFEQQQQQPEPSPAMNNSLANAVVPPLGDAPDADARTFLKVEDWKPLIAKIVKRIWATFTGVNFAQLPANLIAAFQAGDYWWIFLVLGALILVLTFAACLILSLVAGGFWLWNRSEIKQFKIFEYEKRSDPHSFNVGLNFVEKLSWRK